MSAASQRIENIIPIDFGSSEKETVTFTKEDVIDIVKETVSEVFQRIKLHEDYERLTMEFRLKNPHVDK